MATLPLHSEQWDYVRTLLPADLEQSAKAMNALVRCRNVPDAEALMRMALAYAVSDLSLKDVAAWATAMNLAEITGPGLFYRLREAEGWLAHVLAQTLAAQVIASPMKWPLRVVDATVINGPGPVAVQWRAHVLVDPGTGGFRAVELTGNEGGEKLARHAVQSGEVILGDRVYATARGVHLVREQEEDLFGKTGEKSAQSGGYRIQYSNSNTPKTDQESQNLGFGQGHRLDSGASDSRTHTRWRSHLGLDHGSAEATFYCIGSGAISFPLANRTTVQKTEDATAPRYPTLATGTHG